MNFFESDTSYIYKNSLTKQKKKFENSLSDKFIDLHVYISLKIILLNISALKQKIKMSVTEQTQFHFILNNFNMQI